MILSSLLLSEQQEILARAIERKRKTGKEELKLSLFTEDMILSAENPNSYKHKHTHFKNTPLELMNNFIKIIGYKNQHAKITCVSKHQQ